MAFVKGQSGNPKGRPRKSEKYAGQIAEAEDRIAQKLPELIDRMVELANGVTVQEVDQRSGALKVYTRAPDRAAAEYLINRVMGKPTERQEISGPDGDPIELTSAARKAAALELATWRQEQAETLSNTSSAPPTQPTSQTTT